MSILYHVTPTFNVPAILSEGLVPQIGERSAQVSETLPAIYCFAGLAELEDAVMNWMGDYFDEDEPLALLRVEVNPELALGQGADYEIVVLDPIPKTSIAVVYENVWKQIDLVDEAESCAAPR